MRNEHYLQIDCYIFSSSLYLIHLQYLEIIWNNLNLIQQMGFLMAHSHALCAHHSCYPVQTRPCNNKKQKFL